MEQGSTDVHAKDKAGVMNVKGQQTHGNGVRRRAAIITSSLSRSLLRCPCRGNGSLSNGAER